MVRYFWSSSSRSLFRSVYFDVGISTKKKLGLLKISPPESIANAIACGSKILWGTLLTIAICAKEFNRCTSMKSFVSKRCQGKRFTDHFANGQVESALRVGCSAMDRLLFSDHNFHYPVFISTDSSIQFPETQAPSNNGIYIREKGTCL